MQNRQKDLEDASIELIQKLQTESSGEFSNRMESSLLDNAAKIVDSLWLLSDEIMFKYASGFVNDDIGHGGMSQMVGYPAWWLKAVNYQNGPPPPPTKPKCCNPPKPSNTKRLRTTTS